MGSTFFHLVKKSLKLTEHTSHVHKYISMGLLTLEMGRGVPPACSKLDPVPIRLAAKKTSCPNLEINTEFNLSAYGVIITSIFHVS